MGLERLDVQPEPGGVAGKLLEHAGGKVDGSHADAEAGEKDRVESGAATGIERGADLIPLDEQTEKRFLLNEPLLKRGHRVVVGRETIIELLHGVHARR